MTVGTPAVFLILDEMREYLYLIIFDPVGRMDDILHEFRWDQEGVHGLLQSLPEQPQ